MRSTPRHPHDPFDLERFVTAQEPVYAQALSELRAGMKRSHWSWFILPQLRGLGSSPMSVRFGLAGLAEARAYLAHPILGTRLRECVEAMLSLEGLSADEILGEIDAMKFRSCLTLFARAAGAPSPFHAALAKYFAGAEDDVTIAILSQAPEAT